MSIQDGAGSCWSVEAAGGKLKYLVDLFARDVELLDDFVDRGAGFEIFEYGGDGHARAVRRRSWLVIPPQNGGDSALVVENV